MKKITILLGVMLIGLTFHGQTEYQNNKYPNIDSLKTILNEVLIKFQANEKISFLDGDIAVNDDIMYSHYSYDKQIDIFLDTISSKEYIETVLDPNFRNFVGNKNYKFEILDFNDPLYNGKEKWVLLVRVDSEKFDNELFVQFNFHYSNTLQYVSIL